MDVKRALDREMWRERRPALIMLAVGALIFAVPLALPHPKQTDQYVTGKVVSAAAHTGKVGTRIQLAVQLDNEEAVVSVGTPFRTIRIGIGQHIRMACWDTAFGRRYEFREYVDGPTGNPS